MKFHKKFRIIYCKSFNYKTTKQRRSYNLEVTDLVKISREYKDRAVILVSFDKLIMMPKKFLDMQDGLGISFIYSPMNKKWGYSLAKCYRGLTGQEVYDVGSGKRLPFHRATIVPENWLLDSIKSDLEGIEQGKNVNLDPVYITV